MDIILQKANPLLETSHAMFNNKDVETVILTKEHYEALGEPAVIKVTIEGV